MDIRFNADNAIDGAADMAQAVEDRPTERLETRFGLRLTTIEVHVRDLDGDSNRADGVEARLEARLDTVFGKADRHRK